MRSTLKSDITWALVRTLGIALGFSVLVAARDNAFAAAGTPRLGSTTETVVAVYIVCGLYLGFVIGVCRPYLFTFIGRAVVGVLAAWPCTFLFEYVADNPTEGIAEKARDATILALIYGIGCAAVFGKPLQKHR